MKRYIFLFFVLIADILFSQNYGNICTNGLTFYKDSAGNIKAFRLDSTFLPGNNDSIFFSYRTIWDEISSYCYDTTNGSVLGLKVYKKHDGWFFFFNRSQDTIKINSQATLNQTWKFCDLPSNQYIQAKVTAIIPDNVLGTTDMVKIITFQAKDNLNNNVNHILNNRYIKLSQHYGLTKMLYVYYIPSDTTMYFLEGKSSPQMGLQDITWWDVSDYNVGDVFHYIGHDGFGGPQFNMIKNILTKTIASDSTSVLFTFERCVKYLVNPPYQIHDTIEEGYGNFYPFSYFSIGQPQEFRRSDGYYASSCDANLSIYNQRLSKSVSPHYYMNNTNICWGSGIGEVYYLYSFTKGLGNTHYLYNNIGDWYSYEQELVYYERGNEIWGTPVSTDCNTLLGTAQTKSNNKPVIQIIPNPVKTQAEIVIQGHQPDDNLSIILYDYSGKIIFEEKINSNPYNFHRGDLPAGLYILTLYDKTDVVIGREKIMLK
jgi:hypothetical protein